jgi:hypothetical protein
MIEPLAPDRLFEYHPVSSALGLGWRVLLIADQARDARTALADLIKVFAVLVLRKDLGAGQVP